MSEATSADRRRPNPSAAGVTVALMLFGVPAASVATILFELEVRGPALGVPKASLELPQPKCGGGDVGSSHDSASTNISIR